MQLAKMDADVSLDELERAAEQAGIEKALVRKAAHELQPELYEPPRAAGMQTRLVRRRWFDRPLHRREFERLLARLDAFFGAQGSRHVDDDSASWSARHVYVTFEPDREGTLVQVSERFVRTATSTATFGMFLGGTTAFNLVLFIGISLGIASPALFLGVPAALIGGWLGLGFVRRRHALLLERTAEQFEAALESLDRTMQQLGPAGEEEPPAMLPP
jgi:hypothetical protein